MLSMRQKDILEFVVRDYVRRNRPVASVRVHEKNLPQTSTATIRSEMRTLDRLGFLTQEHGSGGRAPTQKAYRHVVDQCIESSRGSSKHLSQQKTRIGRVRHAKSGKSLSAITETLAKELSLFSAVGVFGKEHRVTSCGAEHFFTLPEFQSSSILNDFGYVLDHIEDVLWKYRCARRQTAKFSVFIGRENPVLQMHSFSVFRLAEKRQHQCIVSFLLAPIRTDYERAVAVITDFMQ